MCIKNNCTMQSQAIKTTGLMKLEHIVVSDTLKKRDRNLIKTAIVFPILDG